MADRAESENPRNPAATAAGQLLHLFISYASNDAEVAQRVCSALEAAGFPCWIAPRDVRPGAQYADAIVGAINEAHAVVVVLSGHAVASSHVAREVERAASKHKPIIAFRIDAAALNRALEYFLGESQWIDVSALGMTAALVRLVDALRQGSTTLAQKDSVTRGVVGTPRRAAIVAALVVGLGIAVALGVHFWSSMRGAARPVVGTSGAHESVDAPISDKSIAVLPFVDMSEKKDQEYFADGMAEEILDLLAKVPDLKVVARTSSFQFKGKAEDLRTVGSKLGSAYVVEGSVRRSGTQVRVTAQLINTQDGSHRWSETYDRSIGDVLQMQGQIAAGIARALQVTIAERDVLPQRALRNPEAYNVYLQGRHAVDRYDQSGFEEGVADFQQTLQLDPTFGRAAAWLAWTYIVQAEFGFAPPSNMERARDAATLALRLDPNSAMAYAQLAEISIEYDWDWIGGEREVKRSLELEPRNMWGLLNASGLAAAFGRWEESFRYSNEAIALSPLEQAHWYWLAITRIRAGRLPEAEAACRKTLDISPTYSSAHYTLGEILLLQGHIAAALDEMERETDIGGRQEGLALVYHALGQKADAEAALTRATDVSAGSGAYGLAEVHAFRGEFNEAFNWLDRAYAQKDLELFQIKGDPLLKGLESDPRYKAFLRKMNLPD